ncbi:hypothetical protein NE865_04049 [Phthorimaea operculella]|nr:hypothetical protein NE865_04049 [Phthorimaea operculella]
MKHNTLIHKETEHEIQNVTLSTDIQIQKFNRPLVLLSTALVKVADAQGSLHTARLVLDNCSTSHLVTESLCEKLGLQKVKWATTSGDLQLGTLVLVRDRNQPPLLWLLGRIIKIYPGPDNVNRVADIRTKKRIMQRSFNNICPLPTSS